MIGNGEFRTGINLNNDHQVAGEIFVTGPLSDISLGTTERANLLLGNSELEETVEAFAHSVVEDLAFANSLINQGGRNLALAEAWNVDLLSDVLVRVVKAWLEFFRSDSDCQANSGGAKGFFCRCGHGIFSNWFFLCVFPSGRQDSNLRLPAPKAGALPN